MLPGKRKLAHLGITLIGTFFLLLGRCTNRSPYVTAADRVSSQSGSVLFSPRTRTKQGLSQLRQ